MCADFVASGVLGTMWNGVYLKDGDVPGGVGGGLQANETTFPGFLTLQSSGGGWAGNQDDGFYLYKMVAGDFDVSVQNVPPYDPQNHTSFWLRECSETWRVKSLQGCGF